MSAVGKPSLEIRAVNRRAPITRFWITVKPGWKFTDGSPDGPLFVDVELYGPTGTNSSCSAFSLIERGSMTWPPGIRADHHVQVRVVGDLGRAAGADHRLSRCALATARFIRFAGLRISGHGRVRPGDRRQPVQMSPTAQPEPGLGRLASESTWCQPRLPQPASPVTKGLHSSSTPIWLPPMPTCCPAISMSGHDSAERVDGLPARPGRPRLGPQRQSEPSTLPRGCRVSVARGRLRTARRPPSTGDRKSAVNPYAGTRSPARDFTARSLPNRS